MKSLQQSENRPVEFAAATADEAVRLARAALGADAAVRCWKTRRGGVMGFFAKETFVASLEPPAGATKQRRAASATKRHPATTSPPPTRGPSSDEQRSPAPLDFAAGLAAAIDDDVEFSFSEDALREFSNVLAQAEAALKGADPLEEAVEETSALTQYAATRSVFDDDVAPEPTESSPGPEFIVGLRSGLEQLGVPATLLPDSDYTTLDALVRSLDALPRARSLPQACESVIVVVGAFEDAAASADLVAASLDVDATHIIAAEQTRMGRLELRRRRDAGATSIVVVDAPLRGEHLEHTVAWVASLQPDYVLGAVPATFKRADVRRWCERFAQMDALSLSQCDQTTTPGELMGDVAIAYVEGAPATLLRWVQILLDWLEKGK